MPSIHQHSSGRSPFWFAKYRGADGRVVFRSTRQTDRAKALTIALELERAAGMARQGLGSETQFRKLLSDMLEKTTGESLRNPSVREFLDGWLKGKELSKSEGTHTRYEGTVELFLESLGVRADKGIQSVAPRDIERFRDGQLKAGKASSSVNVDVKTLRTAFNTAWRQGFLQTNPVNAVELPSEKRHERGTFTPEQIQVTLAAAEGEWKTAIMFGYFLGARLSDAVAMTWEQVDLPGKVVRYVQQKTKREVTVPMHADLESFLLTLPSPDNPKVQLTPSLAAREVGGRNGLSREFKLIMDKAGVDDGRIEGKGGKGRSFSTLSFHALRHSFVSHLANAGVPDEVRMRLSGHTSSAVHGKYTKLQLSPLREAVAKLPSVGVTTA